MDIRGIPAALAATVLLGACTTPAPEVPPATTQAGLKWSPVMEARLKSLIQALSKSGVAAVRNKDDQLQFNLRTDFSFASDSADIQPDMREDLDQLAAALNGPAVVRMRLMVIGYTDSEGPDAVNDPLSLARAHNVARYIQGKGVDADRVTVEGRGERQPLVSNAQRMGRALNRRVEIVLMEHPAAPAPPAVRGASSGPSR